MRLNSRSMLATVAGLAILSILVSACASGSEQPTAQVVETEEEEHEEEEGEEHEPEEHMEGQHDVPEEAAAVINPFAGDAESTATGAELYATNCAICHGENGEGDGPAAAGLTMPPSDLHAEHVQENTDGFSGQDVCAASQRAWCI